MTSSTEYVRRSFTTEQLAALGRPVQRATKVAPQSAEQRLESVTSEIVVAQRSLAARTAKRAIDILGSIVGLLVLAPLFLTLAVVVTITSRGPAFFVQERCGLGGRKFRFYKFRTMVVDAEQRRAELEHLNEMSGPVFKMKCDPRITRVGGVLRKLSLDELPQLWNVLKGDMSLVGPRPPLPSEVVCYTSRQAQRLSVMPGLTGLWQVSGRNSIADFDRWLELDLTYARTQSFWLDIRILAKTIVVVLFARGAH